MQNQPKNLAIKTEKRCNGCTYFKPDIFKADAGDLVQYLIMCANADFCENLKYIDKVIIPGYTGKEEK